LPKGNLNQIFAEQKRGACAPRKSEEGVAEHLFFGLPLDRRRERRKGGIEDE
jgi:hypothetical protein